jgi:hypothetical protein
MRHETAVDLARRRLYRVGGCICLGAAAVGVVLPLLPTTPFLLLAAWLFSKSSPALHHRLLNHPRFGPLLRDWQRERAIPRKAKTAAIAALLASWSGLVLTVDAMVAAAAAAVMAPVGLFVATRPLPRRSQAGPSSPSTGAEV